MKLGVLVPLDTNIDAEFAKLQKYGFESCQLKVWDDALKTDEKAEEVVRAKEKYGIEITALWCGWDGPKPWNFTDGPQLLGLVPAAFRFTRMKNLMRGADFAKKIGVTDIATHMGFLPENPGTTEFHEVVSAIGVVANYMAENDQYLLFEAGQETPTTLLRTIQAVGTGNLGINLDTANLILYGKGNPVDALDVFGAYVRDTHIKDGFFPTDGMQLGKQVPVGEGKVDFAAVIEKLKALNYQGALTIEREITGEQQLKDILAAKAYIEKLL